MKSECWKEHWNQAAKDNKDIKLISGWGNRTLKEMLFAITNVAKKLELKREDKLLNVGCGAGLFEIAFACWIKEIYGIDYSTEMTNVAKTNTEKYDNVNIDTADVRNLPFCDEYFDKVLVNSVIQYLNGLNEVEEVFEELGRVTKQNGKILISMNPDAGKKDEYFKGYSKLGLSDSEIEKKIMVANSALWFNKAELMTIAKKTGFNAECRDMDKDFWLSKYYFDLLLIKRG